MKEPEKGESALEEQIKELDYNSDDNVSQSSVHDDIMTVVEELLEQDQNINADSPVNLTGKGSPSKHMDVFTRQMSKIFSNRYKGSQELAKKMAEDLSRRVYGMMGYRTNDSSPVDSGSNGDLRDIPDLNNEVLFGDSIEDYSQIEFDVNIDDNWSRLEQNLQLSAIYRTLAQFQDLRKRVERNAQPGQMREMLSNESRKLTKQLRSNLANIQNYTETLPGMKLLDKASFNFGVIVFGAFAYIMGRWPNDLFYSFYAFIVPSMTVLRWYDWRKSGWHYYLADFCYYANAIVWIFVMFYPKNKDLYHVGFHFSNGILAVSTVVFDNALIFHKLQFLVSLALHTIPMLVLYNIRFVTMKAEADKPEDQRRFLTHDPTVPLFSEEGFHYHFKIPCLVYFGWQFIYAVVMFNILYERIKERNYETLHKWFVTDIGWAVKIRKKVGFKYSQYVFLAGHAVYFFVTHIISVTAYYYEWAHVLFIPLWLGYAVWRGSGYYVKYFNYTHRLEQIEEAKKAKKAEEAQKQIDQDDKEHDKAE